MDARQPTRTRPARAGAFRHLLDTFGCEVATLLSLFAA